MPFKKEKKMSVKDMMLDHGFSATYTREGPPAAVIDQAYMAISALENYTYWEKTVPEKIQEGSMSVFMMPVRRTELKLAQEMCDAHPLRPWDKKLVEDDIRRKQQQRAAKKNTY